MSIKKMTEGQYFLKVMWNVWQKKENPICKIIEEAYKHGIDPTAINLKPVETAIVIKQTIPGIKSKQVRTAKINPPSKPVKTLLARTFTFEGVKNVPVAVLHEEKIDTISVFVHDSLPELPGTKTSKYAMIKNKKYSFRDEKTGELLLTAKSIKEGCSEIRRLTKRATVKSERVETVFTTGKKNTMGTITYHESISDSTNPTINGGK